MSPEERKEMTAIVHDKIADTREEITQLKELTKPIKPDNAYGRLSRMDAINNKSINDAALREQKSRLQKLERALERIEEGSYGTCQKCGGDIAIGRLKFMPWTTRCIGCA